MQSFSDITIIANCFNYIEFLDTKHLKMKMIFIFKLIRSVRVFRTAVKTILIPIALIG